MTWDDVTEMIELWDGEFCLKGVMSQGKVDKNQRSRRYRYRDIQPWRPPTRGQSLAL